MELSHFDLVKEFHQTFGHPVRKEPSDNCFYDEKLREMVLFRIGLIIEEVNELQDAYKNNDIIEFCDALCDILYVVYGAGHCIGYDLTYDNVYNCPEIYIEDHNKHIFAESDELIKTLSENVNTMYEIVYKIEQKHHDLFKQTLKSILDTIYVFCRKNTIDIENMFREVHRSNMSKSCDNEYDAIKSVELYKKDNVYKSPSYRKQGDYFVVFDADTSKILKNYKWTKPWIKQFASN